MKKTLTTIAICSALAISCNNDGDNPDAYGNFENTSTGISCESAGKIIYLNLDEGQAIKQGQLVAIVDTTVLYLQKKQLLAQLDNIDAQSHSVLSQIKVLDEKLKVQTQNQARIQALYKDNSATKKQLDDINGEVNVSKSQISSIRAQNSSVIAQYKTIEAQIAVIDENIKRCSIVNPIDGVVLSKFVENHEFVAPGKTIYSVQNLNVLSLRAYVLETQLAQIKLGQDVLVKVDGGDTLLEFKGKINYISEKSEFTPKHIQTTDERKNLVYSVKIEVQNVDGRLKIGMPASVYFN